MPEAVTETMCEISAVKIVTAVGKKKNTRGEDTRVRINQATLQIIIREGMRGVRHRAVAKEAGVPLGATTYHFKDIEDLIVNAFTYWGGLPSAGASPYVTQILDFLQNSTPELLQNENDRLALAKELYRFTVVYEVDQIENCRDNCIVQQAFYHESIHIEALREEVFRYWQSEVDSLMVAFQALASPDPEADARLCQSVFHQLEREAMMKGESYNRKKLKATLHRYVCHIIGVEFSADDI